MKNTKNTQSKKLITKRDAFIILAVLAAALAALVFMLIFRKPGNTAVITKDGNVIKKISLAGDEESFMTDGILIMLKDGSIGVVRSDCPDKICVKTGFISDKGEKIVCMPKKIIIKIE